MKKAIGNLLQKIASKILKEDTALDIKIGKEMKYRGNTYVPTSITITMDSITIDGISDVAYFEKYIL